MPRIRQAPFLAGRSPWLRAMAALLALSPMLAFGPLARAAAAPWTQARLWNYAARYAISGAAQGTDTWQVRVAGKNTEVTMVTSVPGQSETDRLVLASRGLALVSAQENLHAASTALTITAVSAHGRMAENAVVNGRHEHVSYTLGAATFGNVALLVTLSGTPWRAGQRYVIRDIVLKHAGEARLGLSVARAVRLGTRAGTFTCLPITISSAGGIQTVWIATGPRPVMVRYRNAATTFTLVSLKP